MPSYFPCCGARADERAENERGGVDIIQYVQYMYNVYTLLYSTERKEGPKLKEKLNGNGRKTSYGKGMKEKD